jgi:glycerol-3-phosphate dehydrogenase
MGRHRERTVEELSRDVFDVLVIGGGIVGARVAFDAPLPGASPARDLYANIDRSMADHLLHLYGSETGRLLGYSKVKDNALERITPGAPDLWAQVYHAVREEWALTAEDVIYRRTTLGVRGFDTPEIRQRISTVLEADANSQAHVSLWLRPGTVPQREVVD